MGVLKQPTQCCFCGKNGAMAYWSTVNGGVDVEFPEMRSAHSPDTEVFMSVLAVCTTCALDALPALIADAVISARGSVVGTAGIALERVESRFWRAAYDALARDHAKLQLKL